jgi:hypothetical protein
MPLIKAWHAEKGRALSRVTTQSKGMLEVPNILIIIETGRSESARGLCYQNLL